MVVFLASLSLEAEEDHSAWSPHGVRLAGVWQAQRRGLRQEGPRDLVSAEHPGLPPGGKGKLMCSWGRCLGPEEKTRELGMRVSREHEQEVQPTQAA